MPSMGLSQLVDDLITRFRRRIEDELQFAKELTSIRGALDMVFASSQSVRNVIK